MIDKRWSDKEEHIKQSLLATNLLQDKDNLFSTRRGKWKVYKNIHMRSSWEREFAKLLDENNIKWEYEPKRFNINSEYSYLPDFKLNDDLYKVDLIILDRANFGGFLNKYRDSIYLNFEYRVGNRVKCFKKK